MTADPESLLSLLGRGHGTIVEAFEARARQTPTRNFLFWQDLTWTYGEALVRIREVAACFNSAATPDRPRVAMYLPNCPEAMWTWLGCMFAGRVLVALNRKHRGMLLCDMLHRSHASVLVTESSAWPELASADLTGFATVVFTDVVPDRACVDDTVRMLQFAEIRVARATPGSTISSDSTACLMFTSGTTGRSKAVQVLHNQYVRGAGRLVDGYGLLADDVFHNWLPLYHLAGQLHMTMTAVVCGGAVALQPTFSASRFRDEIRSRNCSVLCGFAAILHFIWALPPEADDALSPLRVGIFAGIPPELHRPFECRFGMRLGENYGMTEVDPVTLPEPGVDTPPASCGRPSADVEVAIVDDRDVPLPSGQLGEICVRPRTPGVLTPGYENDAEASLRAFRNLWFHTGDYGVVDEEGFLYFRGRAGHYVRRRGENVSTAELESIILRHPDVAECAVVGVPSPLGEDDIKTVVVIRLGAAVSPAQIHAYASARMAAFMVPRFIEFMSELPRGDLGKVQTHTLRGITPSTWDAEAFCERDKHA